jgi:lipid-A-disaccharide synthase
MQKENKFLIIAGEPSGDKHAANLVCEIKKRLGSAKFYGIGGDEMELVGVEIFHHINKMAIMGFIEIIRHLPFVKKVIGQLKNWIDKERPKAIILVDYPGFNLHLARIAQNYQIPIIYYICPQLWAWGRGRIKKIRKYVDLPIVIFQFEQDFYEEHEIHSTYVGHPLVDEIEIKLSEKEYREKYHLDSRKDIITLLPGSRIHEVDKLLPIMRDVALNYPENQKIEWVIGKANNIPLRKYKQILENNDLFKIIDNDSYHLMCYAKASIVASGTATLENGYLGTPMIVLYKVSPFSYYIGRMLVKIETIAMANIILGKKVVPEIIQYDLTVENVLKELKKYLENSNYYNNIKKELLKIKDILGEPGAARRAAFEIEKFLSKYN